MGRGKTEAARGQVQRGTGSGGLYKVVHGRMSKTKRVYSLLLFYFSQQEVLSR